MMKNRTRLVVHNHKIGFCPVNMRKSVCSLSIGYTRYLSYINIILYVW